MSQHMELSLHAYNGSWRRSVGAEVVYTPAAGVFAAVVMPTTGMAAAAAAAAVRAAAAVTAAALR